MNPSLLSADELAEVRKRSIDETGLLPSQLDRDALLDHIDALAEERNGIFAAMKAERAKRQADADKLAKVRELLEEIKALGDGTYCRALDIARNPDALGWEIKVQRGEFGRKELEAHCDSSRHIGKHQGYADVRNKLTQILEQQS